MPFYIITPNFITDLPFTRDPYLVKTLNSILIIIDNFIKYTHYIPIIKNVTAMEFTEII